MMKIRQIVNQRRRDIDVEGVIVEMTPVTLSRARKKLMKALLQDDTGSIILNLWGSQSVMCKEGDKVRVTNAFTRKQSGKFELNIHSPTNIQVIE